MGFAALLGYIIFGFVIATCITAIIYIARDYRRWNRERF